MAPPKTAAATPLLLPKNAMLAKRAGKRPAYTTYRAVITTPKPADSSTQTDGLNKIGYTVSSGVDFGNLTSESYYHQCIRTFPTAMAFATAAIAAYYSGGTALIPLFT